jgi:hypothetical protein
MLTKTMIVTAIVFGAASAAVAQNSTAWDSPPGAAWQDKGNIEEQGGQAVLTPNGYRNYRSSENYMSFGAYAPSPRAPSRQAVGRPTPVEQAWFRSAEGPEWN